MNKNLIILSIAVLLICVGLSGCTEESEEGDIIGTWKYLDSILWNMTWTFYDNRTAKILDITEEETLIEWVNYTIDESKLCIAVSMFTNETICWNYQFSNGGQRLTLSADGGILIFRKVL